MDASRAARHACLSKARELKHALMQALMQVPLTGRIRPLPSA
jgi:hypothetical protein